MLGVKILCNLHAIPHRAGEETRRRTSCPKKSLTSCLSESKARDGDPGVGPHAWEIWRTSGWRARQGSNPRPLAPELFNPFERVSSNLNRFMRSAGSFCSPPHGGRAVWGNPSSLRNVGWFAWRQLPERRAALGPPVLWTRLILRDDRKGWVILPPKRRERDEDKKPGQTRAPVVCHASSTAVGNRSSAIDGAV